MSVDIARASLEIYPHEHSAVMDDTPQKKIGTAKVSSSREIEKRLNRQDAKDAKKAKEKDLTKAEAQRGRERRREKT